MPLLLTQSRRVDVVTEQQKLYQQSEDHWNHHLFTIMSKAGSFVNGIGSLEESHSYDYRNEEKGN
jgi:hypothetical protein